MKHCIRSTNVFALTLVAVLCSPGAAVSQSAEPDESPYSRQNPVTLDTDDGKYKVRLHSDNIPVPMNRIHSWTVRITTPDGAPVEDAKIYVHGGMPAHRHGFPTTPRAKTYLGNGEYRIDGVKFSMSGRWEMRINIKQEKLLRRDRAVFQVDL